MKVFQYDNWAYNRKSAQEVVPVILKLFNPQSVIDIGCGTGDWLSVFAQHGVKKILGIDSSDYDETKFQIAELDYLKRDLTKKLEFNLKFDIALCLETAEHLPENCAEDLVCQLTNLSDTIIFSAAIPFQGGQHHVNEKWTDYWQSLFHKRDFYLNDSIRPQIWENIHIHWWYRQNIFVYTKYRSDEQAHFRNSVHPENYEYKAKVIAAYEDGSIGVFAGLKIFIAAIKFKFLTLFRLRSKI